MDPDGNSLAIFFFFFKREEGGVTGVLESGQPAAKGLGKKARRVR